MGNAERRFRDNVSKGDEEKANELYFSQIKNSKRVIDPNSIVIRSSTSPRGSLTLLQCCALYAMDRLYWEFLTIGGAVFSRTSEGETICHLICTCDATRKDTVRFKMLSGTIEKYYKDPQSLTSCIDAKDRVSIGHNVLCRYCTSSRNPH